MSISNALVAEKTWLHALCETSKYIEGVSPRTAKLIFLGDNHLDKIRQKLLISFLLEICASESVYEFFKIFNPSLYQ